MARASYRRDARRDAERWSQLARQDGPERTYTPDITAGLPEIAGRCFAHAIAAGTPLKRTVELEMRGTFLLGDAQRSRSFAMDARQIPRPLSV